MADVVKKGVPERIFSSKGALEEQVIRAVDNKDHEKFQEYAEEGERQVTLAVDAMGAIQEEIFPEGVPETMSPEQTDAFLALFKENAAGSYADKPPGVKLEDSIGYLIENNYGTHKLGAMLVEAHKGGENPPQTPATLLFGREMVRTRFSSIASTDLDKPLSNQFKEEAIIRFYRDAIGRSVADALEDKSLIGLFATDHALEQAIPRLYGHMDKIKDLGPREQFLVALYHHDLVARLFSKKAEEQRKQRAKEFRKSRSGVD